MFEPVQRGKCKQVQHSGNCVLRGDDQCAVDCRGLDATCATHALPEDLDCEDGDNADDGTTDAIEKCAEKLRGEGEKLVR